MMWNEKLLKSSCSSENLVWKRRSVSISRKRFTHGNDLQMSVVALTWQKTNKHRHYSHYKVFSIFGYIWKLNNRNVSFCLRDVKEQKQLKQIKRTGQNSQSTIGQFCIRKIQINLSFGKTYQRKNVSKVCHKFCQ